MKISNTTDDILIDLLEESGYSVKSHDKAVRNDIQSVIYVLEPSAVILVRANGLDICGPTFTNTTKNISMKGLKTRFGEHGVRLKHSKPTMHTTVDAFVSQHDEATVLLESLKVIQYFIHRYADQLVNSPKITEV